MEYNMHIPSIVVVSRQEPLIVQKQRLHLLTLCVFMLAVLVSQLFVFNPVAFGNPGDEVPIVSISLQRHEVMLLQFGLGEVSATCDRPSLCNARVIGSEKDQTQMGVLLTGRYRGQTNLTVSTPGKIYAYQIYVDQPSPMPSPAPSTTVGDPVKPIALTIPAGDYRIVSFNSTGSIASWCIRPGVCKPYLLGTPKTTRGLKLVGQDTNQPTAVSHVAAATRHDLFLYQITVTSP